MFDTSADVRIEIMEALLHNSVVSKDAFDAIASIFENVDGASDDTWAAYKAMFGNDSSAQVIPK